MVKAGATVWTGIYLVITCLNSLTKSFTNRYLTKVFILTWHMY
jgi:hypothetical protein